jgi:pilus assembly protein Flp/PilA
MVNKFAVTTSLEERRLYTMLFLPREEGQGLVEYALVLVLIAVVVIAILLLLGPVVGNVFSNLVANL